MGLSKVHNSFMSSAGAESPRERRALLRLNTLLCGGDTAPGRGVVSGWKAVREKPLLEPGEQEGGGNHTRLRLLTRSSEPRQEQTQS